MSTAKPLIVEHLDTWSSATKAKSSVGRGNGKKLEFYGIKKLRELILELAARGLLVPQDPDDEPVSELLRRVGDERAVLVKRGVINKQTALELIEEADLPYSVPSGWSWARIGTVGRIFSGNSISARVKEEKYTGVDGYPFIATKDVGYGFETINYENGIAIPVGEKNFQVARKDSVLICAEGGSAGKKCGITDRDVCFGNKLFANELHGGILPRFILSVYLTPTFYTSFSESMTGIIGGISKSKFEALVCPIPPLAEQGRIVNKVDELMALCDQLERQQEDSTNTHDTMVGALLDHLTTSGEPGQFKEAWKRIESNFDSLATTKGSIERLKQTILQLAVMGRLVPQDSSDEPASELLKKIVAEKAKLAKLGLIKKQKSEPITDLEGPYPLPDNWCWSRLGDTGIGSTGKTPKTTNADSFGGKIEFIGPGQITPTGQLLESDKTLTERGVEESTEALPGDVLMVCIGGSIGKNVVTDRRVAFNQQINSMRPIHFDPQFLGMAVSTDRFYNSVIEQSTGSATPIINRSKWENLAVPVPPLAEQHRIVVKVEELMKLCDGIMTSLQATQVTQLKLVDSLVEATIN